MIRRLIEADYVHVENPSGDKIKFWLMESRTPRMLVELAQRTEKKQKDYSLLVHYWQTRLQATNLPWKMAWKKNKSSNEMPIDGIGSLCSRN